MHDPSLRPANLTRSLMHIGSGLAVLILIQLLVAPKNLLIVAASAAVLAWSLELGRRYSADMNRFLMWLFGPVAHAHEARSVNSSTWYTTALLALALTGSPLFASIGVAVLGIGDPAAAWIGRRYGKIRFASGRSLEGSMAFVLAGALASILALGAFYPELGLKVILACSITGALGGAIAELCCKDIDDNLLIPLAAAASAAAAGVLFS
jgi:dolichol kinase